MQTILVTDVPAIWNFLGDSVSVVHASDYLSDEQYPLSKSLRVINLCQSYQYQTIGYYVSLLAQARGHKAIPSVLNLQDTLSSSLSIQISHDADNDLQEHLEHLQSNHLELNVYFGHCNDKKYAILAKKLHALFALPLLQFNLEKKKTWSITKITLLTTDSIAPEEKSSVHEAAINYFSKKRFHQWRKKPYFHNVAILIDETEAHPPSDKKALQFFAEAGAEIGLHVDFINKHDKRSIAEYDALFIRATTAVDHHTYRLARRALQENLVVIDDPQSIVRCSNKVYLAELMRSHQIATPETIVLSKYHKELPPIQYPCVLKKPDGAFSLGVIKLENEQALKKSLKQFFKTSDLVLIQPFIPTAYDWRIGVLDNKPLFASRYYMAEGHWQIYDWKTEHDRRLAGLPPMDPAGADDSVPIQEVPEKVVKTALKAARLIGDGLYGVDIKSYEDKHYVIEVNDNPNIDADVEDKVLGPALYHDVMNVFLQKIRKKHGYA